MAEFNKQAYLLSYFDEISNILTYDLSETRFSSVYLLPSNNQTNFSKIMSVLQNRMGIENFTKLKTYQYNGITPKIRLYRIDYNDQKQIIAQKQFVFEKDAKYTVESMLKPIKKDNCGIKSINWKLAGTNPVTAEKQIEVEIQLYFDSINAFSGGSFDDMTSAWNNSKNITEPFKDKSFSFCEFDETTKNYWSLLFHPQVEKDKYDTYKFRIKAEVGWEDIGENIKSQLNLSDAEESIKKLNYTFFLNLVKHQFNFNEDGSLVVVANYIASFESTTMNKQFDVLGGLQEEIDDIKKLTIAQLAQIQAQRTDSTAIPGKSALYKVLQEKLGIEQQEAIALQNSVLNLTLDEINSLSILSNALSDTVKSAKLDQCSNLLPEAFRARLAISKFANISTNELLAKAASAITEDIKTFYEYFVDEAQVVFYSALIENLINEDKYYSVFVPDYTQKAWLSWYETKTNKPAFKTIHSLKGQKGDTPTALEYDKMRAALQTDAVRAAMSGDEAETAVEQLKENTQYTLPDNTKGFSIVFTTFGDFINTAFRTIRIYLNEKLEKQKKANLSYQETQSLLNEFNKINIMFSNISDENIILQSGNSSEALIKLPNYMRNIALIPIEMNLIRLFLIENIIKPKKRTYPLFSFIKDAMSSLLLASINSFENKNDQVDKYSNLSLGSFIFNLGNSVEEEPFNSHFYKYKDKTYPIIEPGHFEFVVPAVARYGYSGYTIRNKLEDKYLKPENKDIHKYFYTYFVIYDKNLTDFRPKNNAIEDEKQGVYHYTYAQDYGLIKSINFSKIDQPYLKEAKAVGKKTFYLGQFRDRYNADITMIGNNIYYPGMMLYISPSVEATIKTGNNASFSQISGIGGYYFVNQVESSITEDGYETKLKTIWQTDGYDLPNSIEEEDTCKAFLQDIGIVNQPQSDKIKQALDIWILTTELKSAQDTEKELKNALEELYSRNSITPSTADRIYKGEMNVDMNVFENFLSSYRPLRERLDRIEKTIKESREKIIALQNL